MGTDVFRDSRTDLKRMALGLTQRGPFVADVASPSGSDSWPRALPWAASPLPQTHSPKLLFSQQTGREARLSPGLGNWKETSCRHGWSSGGTSLQSCADHV